ncbi:MAG: SRPBCC family protein [Verrucomicrobiota bacterium]|nr:SRPBCC family protein [Verrucomicrobiota bacterium]
MPIYTLKRTQTVALPLERYWRFFSDPRNLEKITPPTLGFQVKSELPEEIHAGLMIRYTVSPLFKFPLTWLTEITQVERPNYFVDEQRTGPYRLWHHEHFFRALDAGRTEIRDLVHYAPPLGPFGAVLNKLLVRPQLERIFAFRSAALEKLVRGSFA